MWHEHMHLTATKCFSVSNIAESNAKLNSTIFTINNKMMITPQARVRQTEIGSLVLSTKG